MKNYLKTNGVRMAALVLIIALLFGGLAAARGGNVGLLHNAAGVLIAPVQKVVSSAVNLFDSIYGQLSEYDELVAENESLREQLAGAQQAARDGVEASEENERLRETLSLRAKHTDYEFESAKVVLWTSSNWSHSFKISKGRSSGIELGDPVVTEYKVVVGQITEIGETWATVSTVIDVDMSLGAFVGQAGTAGLVVGEYALMKERRARLTSMVEGAQIFEGDEVLSSGAGGAFPAGLVIGRIVSVETDGEGRVISGLVEPECAFDSLVQVYIIKDYSVVE